jgi:hypothetical protein
VCVGGGGAGNKGVFVCLCVRVCVRTWVRACVRVRGVGWGDKGVLRCVCGGGVGGRVRWAQWIVSRETVECVKSNLEVLHVKMSQGTHAGGM